MGHLPRSIMAEITPPWARGAVSAISASLNWAIIFLFLLVPWVEELRPNAMWQFNIGFSALSVMGSLMVFILVPETKGLTLVEINALMKKSTTVEQ